MKGKILRYAAPGRAEGGNRPSEPRSGEAQNDRGVVPYGAHTVGE